MNKEQKRENSIQRVLQAYKAISQAVPEEMKRESRKRRESIVNAWDSMSIHAYRLGLEVPQMGIYYAPAEYLSKAEKIKNQLDEMLEEKTR